MNMLNKMQDKPFDDLLIEAMDVYGKDKDVY